MKKLGIILLVLVMVLALAAGCKDKYTPSAKTPSANREIAKGSVSADSGIEPDQAKTVSDFFKALEAESGGASFKEGLSGFNKDGAVSVKD